MSRWHKPSCHAPTVSVEDGVPRCQSCSSSPDVQKLILEQAGLSMPWTVPPDERFGEMNLCWPESVRYSPQTEDTATTNAREATKGDVLGRQDAPSPIYNRRLGVNEFRLLYLDTIDNESYPIHANLETYQTDDCPEYETVSYCWGGENDDTMLCKPIFLGDYWDILLQTKNCWSMLHYLCPRVGVRVVWVDAICINQKDHQERESQVAMMGSIYQQCLRAVVYLGKDVARSGSTENRAYPTRRILNKVSASNIELHQLLKMRYFQRVWVIQELIRAPMVVIPARGVELTAGQHTASREAVAWDDSNAPWMKHICSGQSDTPLRKILEQTRHSDSTDPRDKVFGLLGFLPGDKGLRPNYLLSSLHVYIGTIAYMLLNEGHSHLLTEAAGYRAPPTTPSWLPDENLPNIGVLLKKLSPSISRPTSLGATFRNTVLNLNPNWETLLLVESGHDEYDSGHSNSRWRTPWLANSVYSEYDGGHHNQAYGPLETLLPASVKPSIDPSTSALSLPLIYLWESLSRPVEVYRDDVTGCLRVFKMTAANCTLYVCTSDALLDSAVEPGRTSVFLLKDKKNSPLILFMRRLHPGANYRLIRCCPCSGIFLSRTPSSKPKFPPSFGSFGSVYRRPSSPVSFDQKLISILDETVYNVVSKAEELRNESWAILERMRVKTIPLNQDSIAGHLFSLFHKLAAEPEAPLTDLYFSFVRQCSPDCCVEVKEHGDEAWVYVSMDPNEWLTVHESLNSLWYQMAFSMALTSSPVDDVGPWYWARVPGSSDLLHGEKLKVYDESATHVLYSWTSTESRTRRPVNSWFDSRNVTMVTKLEGLRKWLRDSPYCRLFSKLRVCSRLVNKDEAALAMAAPEAEYRSICFYDWPESFFNGKQIPGKLHHVTIF